MQRRVLVSRALTQDDIHSDSIVFHCTLPLQSFNFEFESLHHIQDTLHLLGPNSNSNISSVVCGIGALPSLIEMICL